MSLSRHLAKRWLLPTLDAVGLMHRLRQAGPTEGGVCLSYHNVDPSVFRPHAQFLARHAQVIDADRFLKGVASWKKPVVILTFDDGYAFFSERIVPILREFGLPATWFVPTEAVAAGRLLWSDRVQAAIAGTNAQTLRLNGKQWCLKSWNRPFVTTAIHCFLRRASPEDREKSVQDLLEQTGSFSEEGLQRYRPASPAQLAAVDSRLITIGSHSHTHSLLTQLDADPLRVELTASRKLLQEWTGRPVRHFAFPFGEYNASVLKAVREAGYVSAWTTHAGWATAGLNPYQLPRILIDDVASAGVLSAKITPLMSSWGWV